MRRYTPNKQINQLIAEYVAKGWQWERGGVHNRMVAPDGRFVVFANTPSDPRAYMNIRASFRRKEREIATATVAGQEQPKP